MKTDLDAKSVAQAIAWHISRVPMTKAAWQELSARERRRAFVVSEVAQADVVFDVWKAVDKAVSEGQSLAEFKRTVGPTLRKAWGGSVANPGARIATIFETNVQMAYSAGRWAELTRPEALQKRPYLVYDAVLDKRTSRICRRCNGTILPADNPWWQTHLPPLHHHCRSAVRALTVAQAKRFGKYGRRPPVAKPDDGFGRAPKKSDWKPDLSKYPAKLREKLKRRLDAYSGQ